MTLASPGQVRLGGLLGDRYAANLRGRLLLVDEDELLAGFRHKPGKHPWIGEHVGKWLQLERTVYNHLLAAQRADGAAWCYYTALDGRRHPTQDTCCCLSSGPRGIALLPLFAYASRPGGVDVNLYGPSRYDGVLALTQTGDYPFAEDVRIVVERDAAAPVALRLRIPAWVAGTAGSTKDGPVVRLNGRAVAGVTPGRYVELRRAWKKGDVLDLRFPMPVRTIEGTGDHAGRRAFAAGPLVYAAEFAALDGATNNARLVAGRAAPVRAGARRLELAGEIAAGGRPWRAARLVLVPFFEAGTDERPYAVWLATTRSGAPPASLMYYADESQSAGVNARASFSDGDPATAVDTYDGRKHDADWFAIEVPEAVTVGRIVFRHGKSHDNGGWFDTSSSKPRVEVRRAKDGPWEPVATLDAYPATDGAHDPGLAPGQAFEVRFAPAAVVGIRIVGQPAWGTGPGQSFSSCAEIEAYAR